MPPPPPPPLSGRPEPAPPSCCWASASARAKPAALDTSPAAGAGAATGKRAWISAIRAMTSSMPVLTRAPPWGSPDPSESRRLLRLRGGEPAGHQVVDGALVLAGGEQGVLGPAALVEAVEDLQR